MRPHAEYRFVGKEGCRYHDQAKQLIKHEKEMFGVFVGT